MPRTTAHPLRNHPEFSVITTYDNVSSRPTGVDMLETEDEVDGNRGLISVEYRVDSAAEGSMGWRQALAWWLTRGVIAITAYLGISAAARYCGIAQHGNRLAPILVYGVWGIFLYMYNVATISETALAFPSLGIQLNTTSGFLMPIPFHRHSTRWISLSRIEITIRSTFIPLGELSRLTSKGTTQVDPSSVFLNEGFTRWSVRYYLGIMARQRRRKRGLLNGNTKTRQGRRVHVVFDGLRPRIHVLEEVYHGLRETMFGEYADEVEAKRGGTDGQ